MLSYEPDRTLAHRLDARSKLCFQIGFAVAAVWHRSFLPVVVVSLLALAALAAARLSPIRVLVASRFILGILAIGVLIAMLVPHHPWLVPARAAPSLRSAVGVVLVLFVAGAYVRSTPVRDTRAAIQRYVPGKPGQLLGVGVALVYRFFPVLVTDVGRTRDAIRARGGGERSAILRTRMTVRAGIRRAFHRADRLSLALRARAFAWNPTLPPLSVGPADYPVAVLGVVLGLSPVLTL